MRKLRNYTLGFIDVTAVSSISYWTRLKMYGNIPVLSSIAPSSFLEALGQCTVVSLVAVALFYYIMERTK